MLLLLGEVLVCEQETYLKAVVFITIIVTCIVATNEGRLLLCRCCNEPVYRIAVFLCGVLIFAFYLRHHKSCEN